MQLSEVRETIECLYGSPMSVMSDCIRGFIIPKPDHDFIAFDFNQIEARVLPWLAGEEAKLEIFRGHGLVYEAAAAAIHNCKLEEITKDDIRRLIGKIAELALGFGGGVGAFQKMAKVYGLKITDEKADDIKRAWREVNPNIVRYWYSLQLASLSAAYNPGQTFHAGPPGREVAYKRIGTFLWCKLPSGRVLCYPYPQVDQVFNSKRETYHEGLTYMGEDSQSHKWVRKTGWGGLLAENVTQAVARDLLVHAMFKAEKAGYPVVLHCHDELVCEVPKDFGSLEELEQLVTEVPTWAKQLPIAAEGWRGDRYRK